MATPQNDGGVSKALSDSKKLLNKVNNGNVATKSGKPFEPAAKNAAAGAAAKKASGAGIMEGLKKMAQPAKDLGGEAESAAAGLKAKADNVAEYESSLPKMHKGGKVKKDGAHNLKKGEVVLTEKTATKMGVKDGAKEKDSKAPKKKKKTHGGKHTHIEHHTDGSHTRTVTMDDGSQESSAHPDDASLMEAMQGQMSTPAPAPQQQGQGGGAPDPAAAGGAPA